jgi:hypothetical protein
MRTRAWFTSLVLAGLAVGCGDQPTEVVPEREGQRGPGMIALATSSSDDGLSITTDKDDYAPGDTVWFTGAGWPAADILEILLTDNTGDEHRWSIPTAENGTFRDSTYVVNTGDLGVTFTLTATSQGTGRWLTVTFTDAELVTAELAAPQNEVTVTRGSSANFTISLTATGAIKCIATSSTPATAKVHTVFAISSAGAVTSSTLSGAFNFFGGDPQGGPNCVVTWTGAPTAYAASAAVSAAAATPIGDYTITLNPATGRVELTNPTGPGGSLADEIATTITVHVVAPTNQAPTVDAEKDADPNAYSGGEGLAISLSGDASDPDGDAVTTTWSVDNTTLCSIDDPNSLNTTVTCSDNGTFTLTLSGTDGKISTPVTSTATLAVTNVAPTATGLTTNSPVDEGDDIVFSLTGVADASSVDATSLRYAFDCGDGNFSASTYAAASSINSATCPTTDNGTRTVRGKVFDKDGDVSTIQSAQVTIDNVPPTISTVVASPAGQLTLGSNNQVSTTVTVTFTDPAGTNDEDYTTSITCDNGAAAVTGSPKTYGTSSGSSSATCTYTAATVGVRTISATVTDKDGGVSTAKTTTVQVIYNWTGFFQPVDNNNLNVAKAGSAIPVKFNLGGNQGLNIFWTGDAKAYPNSSQVNCSNINDDQDSIEETVNAGNSSLTYDTTAGQYIYVWKSEKSWAGTCRRLDVKLADGTMHQAYFKWTK